MQLEKLIIKNFLSFKLAHLDLLNQGLVLISGLNGSGKSSLTSKAITWGLFGQTPSGLKGDSIENKNKLPTEPTEVIIWLDDGSYIRRGRNPNFVEISGEQFRLASDCQDHINNLINKDFKTFLNTDYFGQDRQIRFLDQSPKFQLELLEEILKLDSLDKYIQKTSEEIKEIEDKLISLERQESVIYGALNTLNSQYSVEIGSVNTKTNRLNFLLNQKKNNKNYTFLVEKRDELISRKKIIEDQLLALRSNIEQKNNLQFTLKANLDSLRKQIRSIQDSTCPTCNQEINKDITDRLKEEQKKLADEIPIVSNEYNSVIKDFSILQVQEKSLQKEQTDIYNKLIDLNQDIVLEVGLEAEIKNIDTAIKELRNSLSSLEDLIRQNKSQTEKNKKEINELEKKLSIYKFWKSAFSKDFKTFVIQQTLPYLEDRANHHLRLLNNPQISLKFSNTKELKNGEERDGLSITASISNGGASYDALSGGEKQIASFAVGLALSEIADFGGGQSSNVIILDEPFTELDNKNCENVILYLQNELIKRKSTILLISNDDRMKSLVSNVFEIYKDENGYSHII